MDIAALSTALANVSLRQDVNMALMTNVMDTAKQNNDQMIDMIKIAAPQAPHPTLGHSIDLKG
jgi:hypothetical protein